MQTTPLTSAPSSNTLQTRIAHLQAEIQRSHTRQQHWKTNNQLLSSIIVHNHQRHHHELHFISHIQSLVKSKKGKRVQTHQSNDENSNLLANCSGLAVGKKQIKRKLQEHRWEQ